MNILFFSLFEFQSINDSGIYPDLLREFIRNGHSIFVLSPVDERICKRELSVHEHHVEIARVYTGRIQKTNTFEKGINMLLIESRFINAIKKYYSNVSFDLVLYPTPPITLANVVKFVKKRDNAKTYLMLKDIFPQNAVDIGMMRNTGIHGLLYKYFRRKEKELYKVSDWIGCMSQANIDYVTMHNPEIPLEKIELCPNSMEVRDINLDETERIEIRKKYGLPLDKKVFVYGGNLGKPQGIPFLIECLKTQLNNLDAFFLIIGSGTEYGMLKNFFDEIYPENMCLLKSIPKEDYDRMIAACDVGLIFLDHRFTIPNFPSRLLSYMQAKLPVLACTDSNTDIGKVIVDGRFGWWCESDDVDKFQKVVQNICIDDNNYGANGYKYLLAEYSITKNYNRIAKHLVGNILE